MNSSADLQSVFAQFLPDYQTHHPIDARRRQVLAHLGQCRTAVLGGLEFQCERCEYRYTGYHSCRDRHCPKCQHRASRRWAERQSGSLLPVPYFHLVFTLPHALNGWVQLHDGVLYRALFQSVWSTLKRFGRDPRRGLNGQLGMTAVLHTWGESLSRHVHLHCLVPGGALRADGRWQATKGTYLFPVKALARHYRGAMVRALRQAAAQGELVRVTREGELEGMLDTLMSNEWVVYAKSCLAHERDVLGYLARYTHRIAISDHRVVEVTAKTVRFRYKDTAKDNASRIMTLAGDEFVRRYLQHILPKGLMRIRHYGFLSNRCRRSALSTIRSSLQHGIVDPGGRPPDPPPPFDGLPCPHCTGGWMLIVAELPPSRMDGG